MKPNESCGIVGVIANNIYKDSKTYNINIYDKIYYALFALQHRGQESAGISISSNYPGNNSESTSYPKIKTIKKMGLVRELRNDYIEGNVGIGHVRYSTTGESVIENAQPLKISYQYKNSFEEFSIAHNGNIINTEEIKQELQGMSFVTTSDSEVIGNLIVYYHVKTGNFYEAIKSATRKLIGSFCLVILHDGEIIAVRDSHGIRPLVLGQSNIKDKNNLPIFYCVASESCALDAINFSLIRSIEPGEILIISQKGDVLMCETYYKISEKISHCMFEYVYFSRADSIINDTDVYKVRKKLGELLAEESYVDADLVIPVPESGITAALGFFEWCLRNGKNISYGEGLMKNRYSVRSFILPKQEERDEGVKIKLNPMRNVIEGKRLILIDDSIVRGTTTRTIVKNLKDAGAKEVHVRITCPPIKFPCELGIDMHTSKEFIARDKTIEEIRKEIGADSLHYLTMESLIKAIGTDKLCVGCLTGKYPVGGEQIKIISEDK